MGVTTYGQPPRPNHRLGQSSSRTRARHAVQYVPFRVLLRALASRRTGSLPHRPQNYLLLAASYYFYACWDPRFLALLILSTVMDYACGLAVDRIEEPRKRKLFVALSMALNLGMLGYFKYYNFFAESLQAALARAGSQVPLSHLNVVLPIGISFYTFQSMSYVIDVYRRDIKPTRNLLEFAAFVSFFPHLVAGPIMRPTTLLPQIAKPRRFDLDQFYQGAYLIFWGLTKKVVVADNLALIVNDLFGKWQTIDGGLALLAIYAFAFQIYCDFSGYTDAARGIAKCLGFELALNFNLPYFATSPQDFWARWHISLSTWLRDYLYIPLGGNRGGTVHALPQPDADDDHRRPLARRGLDVRALGRYQGVILVAHRLLKPWLDRIQPDRARSTAPAGRPCGSSVTFHLVCLGWLIFRASPLSRSGACSRRSSTRPAIPAVGVPAADPGPASCRCWSSSSSSTSRRTWTSIAGPPGTSGASSTRPASTRSSWRGEFGGSQFIYFQFSNPSSTPRVMRS